MGFDLLDRRLKFARDHINVLERSYRMFVPKLQEHRVVVEPNPATGTQVAKVRLGWVVPDDWGLRVGEVAHHLRAVLDNAVCQLLPDGVQPTVSTEFPVATTREWFAKVAPRKLAGLSAEAYAAIERLQPFGQADVAAVHHPLWLLHELDIIDKHQSVHVAAVVAAQSGWNAGQAHVDAGMTVRLWYQPLEDGTPIAEFMFATPCAVPVKATSKATLEVKILETERTPYLPFPGFLLVAHEAVREVVDALRAV
jgi:hypothetical protein